MKRTLTVTLNPALDLTTAVPAMVSGRKMRCEVPRVEPGGGGVNVSRAIAKLGRSSKAFVAIGGGIGKELRARLRIAGIDGVWFDAEVPTRQSFAVHDKAAAVQYRFVLPGETWSLPKWRECTTTLAALFQPDDLIIISGSLPPGVPKDAHRIIAGLADSNGQHVIVDTSGEPLATIALGGASRINTIVMDESEALSLTQQVRLEMSAAVELGRTIVARGAARLVIVTLGERGAVAVECNGTWHVAPPRVSVASKVGAGDSFVAGLTIGLAENRTLPDALTYAMGAAASAVTTPASELCTREGTETLALQVTCRKL
jgi:6-phosphofructokinase 2